MKPTDETVERVARALCRLQVLRNVEIGAYKADIERGVEMCWVHFQGEARAAIAAMPELPAQGEPVATEQIDAGAQALANDVWNPPQKLENMTGSEANKFRRQARIVLVAALSLVKP